MYFLKIYAYLYINYYTQSIDLRITTLIITFIYNCMHVYTCISYYILLHRNTMQYYIPCTGGVQIMYIVYITDIGVSCIDTECKHTLTFGHLENSFSYMQLTSIHVALTFGKPFS